MVEIKPLRRLLRKNKLSQLKSIKEWGSEFVDKINFADSIYFEMLMKEVKDGSRGV